MKLYEKILNTVRVAVNESLVRLILIVKSPIVTY